ncbi:C4-dicarboxylate ABC transporter substrate-binding protein [candidate division KSB3 bacterium]|uniref:C4-dicarboxylate ABC transporter substrate-binding protein n=1 Tax=candidate division KSB3 bacterium TaxID=2044937 RepID=A0A2G6E203_9BACT|nr:MAG: C4-dicarboxylate ABC transporter substrate-binding protein [candidate division KSB3 bacterium]PIE28758.1 MAG: C4-dicarboxylate ABC transporter substrate-binding protein [candidate division KSB3 bacterium]
MKKVLNVLDNVEEYLTGAMLLLMAIMYFLEVVLRYVFSSSNAWVEELLRYMMVFITFFGASVAVKYGSHMSVNVVEYIPSSAVKRLIEIFVALMGIVFSVLILYFSCLLVLRVKGFGQRSPALQVPMYIPYAILPLGFASMLVRFSHQLLKSLNIRLTQEN